MMRIVAVVVALCVVGSVPAAGQSLHLPAGTSGLELSGGWAVGPSSNGIETHIGASLGGKVDVGVQVSHYELEFDDGFTSAFEDYAPFVRWFPVKQQSGAPVSMAVSGQLFVDDYESDEDSGKYVQLGMTAYKAFTFSNAWSLTPFAGFGFVAESYAFGGGPSEEAQYLTRDFGLHVTSPEDRPWMVRFTLIEQSFRRETYRGARVGLIRRF
jgi:hypothetical protein